jgi:hypothetical protein
MSLFVYMWALNMEAFFLDCAFTCPSLFFCWATALMIIHHLFSVCFYCRTSPIYAQVKALFTFLRRSESSLLLRVRFDYDHFCASFSRCELQNGSSRLVACRKFYLLMVNLMRNLVLLLYWSHKSVSLQMAEYIHFATGNQPWRNDPSIKLPIRADVRCYVPAFANPNSPEVIYNHLGPIHDFRVWKFFSLIVLFFFLSTLFGPKLARGAVLCFFPLCSFWDFIDCELQYLKKKTFRLFCLKRNQKGEIVLLVLLWRDRVKLPARIVWTIEITIKMELELE